MSDLYDAEWHEFCEEWIGKDAEEISGYLFFGFFLKYIREAKEP